MKKIYLYCTQDGNVPFINFMRVVEPKMRKKLRQGLMCIAAFPDYMTEPHVKHFSIARYDRL